MRLSYRIVSRVSITLLLLLTVWATLFYFIIMEETNDETDDSLENYSENIIRQLLAGAPLPPENCGSGNTYAITEVSPEYVVAHPTTCYFDETIYIPSKKETEPVRSLKTIFKDGDGKFYELKVSIPTIEKADLQETILGWIVFLYLSLLILIIAINVWILNRSFKPLYALLNWLERFKVGESVPELKNDTATTEFRKLNEAIIRAAHRNVEAYEQQKSFIAHASHELQTPLAISRNKLELLLEDPELNEKQLNEIFKAIQSINHIIQLNRTLLLFTKIENNQFPEKSELTINNLIKRLLNDYSNVYARRNISVSICEDALFKANMNETLASILFGNLLKNAYIHNCNNGTIDIRITSSSFAVSNSGADQPLDGNLIFKRFYQGVRKEGSIGLGLSLAMSVCKLYGMKLQYDYRESKHTFIVSF